MELSSEQNWSVDRRSFERGDVSTFVSLHCCVCVCVLIFLEWDSRWQTPKDLISKVKECLEKQEEDLSSRARRERERDVEQRCFFSSHFLS